MDEIKITIFFSQHPFAIFSYSLSISLARFMWNIFFIRFWLHTLDCVWIKNPFKDKFIYSQNIAVLESMGDAKYCFIQITNEIVAEET